MVLSAAISAYMACRSGFCKSKTRVQQEINVGNDIDVHVIINKPTAEEEKPSEWQPQSSDLELFSVEKGSTEWNDIERNFKSTLPNTHINQISRIQNKWLWDRYCYNKQRVHRKNKGNVNEKELFHGTRGNDPKLIYGSEVGFDMRYSAQGMWGQANYFAVNASYSDSYAHQKGGGLKEIFLVKVLTGDSYSCASNTSLRMPPEKHTSMEPRSSLRFTKTRYDTVTGTTDGSIVYMAYDNDKAYPAYLIQYK